MKRIAVVLAAAMAALVLMSGCFRLGVRVPKEAAVALQDAASCSDEFAERYERFAREATGGHGEGASGDASAGEFRTFDVASAEVTEDMHRVSADIDAVERASGAWEGREQALAAMQNLQGMLSYELDILRAQQDARSAAEGETGTGAALKTIATLDDAYRAIDPPDCLAGYLHNTVGTMPAIEAALAYSVAEPDSTLSQRTTSELLSWWMTKQGAYDAECDVIMARQCEASGDVLRSLAEGKPGDSGPKVSVTMIDEIAPNLYPSLDAVANLGITSPDGTHSVQVEVEVVGFSQRFEQKYDLAQGYSYLPIKPAVLPAKDLSNLTSNTTTQLNVKVTDARSGEVLLQESHPVELLSMYDFRWANDEFGKTASFDILSWLRPQADEVGAVNRKAADVLGSWTGGAAQLLPGYQAGSDPVSTLLQVAAIQKAISDSGVAYVMDGYSFMSDQHVLTPDAVVQKRQGLCIETSLLMASCLMSAGMHPLIVITPSHAQVAVESYPSSGSYFLVETTVLPYGGVDTSVSNPKDPAFYNGLLASAKTDGGTTYWTLNGSSEEWRRYFDAVGSSALEFDGIFVIDCDLQQIMGIQGLEGV